MTGTPFRLGLTGSIGMGKTTTAGFFAEAGVPVWDADAAVHRIYAPGGPGAAALADLVPAAIRGDQVDREALRAAVGADPELLRQLEARIHPLVAADRARFAADHAGADILLYDIPLLFETGAEKWLNAVLVVTAAPEVQRGRLLARPGMDEDALAAIMARQMPDAEKRARADHVIRTDRGLEAARAAVQSLLQGIRERRAHA